MFLFDNNAFKLLVVGDTKTLARVREQEGRVYLSSVAAEELIAVHMNTMNRARAPRTSLSLARAHEDFVETLDDLRILPLFAYSPGAERIYRTFSAATIREGAQDCRIAAQAMAHGMTVVTHDLDDFTAIGALCVDWSA